MTTQIAVETAKVVTLAPSLDHGDTIVRPRPDPRSIKIKVSVDAAKAPATIGPQLTADDEDSTEALAFVADMVAMASSYRMNSASRMMIGMGTPSSQSRMPRPMMVSFRVKSTNSHPAWGVAVEFRLLSPFHWPMRPPTRQRLVRVGLFLQRLVEQLDGVFQAENMGPALERAVARDLVVLDRLGGRDQTGVDRWRSLEAFDNLLALGDDAFDRVAGLALSPLAH